MPVGNAVYPFYKHDLLAAATTNLDLLQSSASTAPFCALVGTYTYAAATDHFYTALTDVRNTDQQITGNSVNNAGTFISSGSLTYSTVTAGSAINSLVIYRKNAGASSTWSLVLYIDTASGLAVVPNGGNITVTWATTPISGNIFTL